MTYIPHTDIIRNAYVDYMHMMHRPGEMSDDEYRAEFDAWHLRQMTRRPKRGVVETTEQLDALPPGSVIGIERNGCYYVYERGDTDWWSPNDEYWDMDWLPADIVWTPHPTVEGRS